MEGLRPLLSMSEGGTKAETDRILSALPLHQRDRYMKVLVVLREKYFRHPSRNGTEVREQGVDCPTSRHSECEFCLNTIVELVRLYFCRESFISPSPL